MSSNCFILEGNGASVNRGCQAIFRTTVEILRDVFGPCRFVNAPAALGQKVGDVDKAPDVVHLLPQPIIRWGPRWVAGKLQRKLLGVESIPRYSCTRHLKRSRAVLALGGDNYSLDYGRPDRFFEIAELTRRVGKPFVLWGSSVGSFAADPEYERFAAARLKQVSLICARESETVRYLTGIGVEGNVKMVADPAFLLKPSPPPISRDLETALASPCLGLNLSGLMGRYRPSADRWLAEAASWVTSLLGKSELPVVLIPHAMSKRDDDYLFLSEVQQRVRTSPNRLLLVPREYDCQQLKWVIAQLHAFIGARTHATIAALSSCVPTLSIGYSLKSHGINHDIFGHKEFVIPIDKLDAEVFTRSIAQLLDDRDDIQRHLQEIMPVYCERARDGAKHLARLLDPSATLG